MSPPISMDIFGAVPSVVLDCACTGGITPKIPPMIAKAATTAVSVVFIKQYENTVNLKGISENSRISFYCLL
jgi:hypothetical protein